MNSEKMFKLGDRVVLSSYGLEKYPQQMGLSKFGVVTGHFPNQSFHQFLVGWQNGLDYYYSPEHLRLHLDEDKIKSLREDV